MLFISQTNIIVKSLEDLTRIANFAMLTEVGRHIKKRFLLYPFQGNRQFQNTEGESSQ